MEINTMPKNYDFVPFAKPNVKYSNSRDNSGRKSGYLKIKFIVEKELYVGSGFVSESKNGFTYETMKHNGKCVIPGSSVKGVIRNICRAVSDGCIPFQKEKIKVREDYKGECIKGKKNGEFYDNWCIVCDMFGSINPTLKSRISFSDFVSENAEVNITDKIQQFSPNPNSESYFDDDGYHKGYKFYNSIYSNEYDDDYQGTQKIKIEKIEKGSEFEGKILFKNIKDEELSLLVFALGLDGNILIKIGGFKAQGMGDMRSECIELRFIDNKGEYNDGDITGYIKKYVNGYGSKFNAQIKKLEEIQSINRVGV